MPFNATTPRHQLIYLLQDQVGRPSMQYSAFVLPHYLHLSPDIGNRHPIGDHASLPRSKPQYAIYVFFGWYHIYVLCAGGYGVCASGRSRARGCQVIEGQRGAHLQAAGEAQGASLMSFTSYSPHPLKPFSFRHRLMHTFLQEFILVAQELGQITTQIEQGGRYTSSVGESERLLTFRACAVHDPQETLRTQPLRGNLPSEAWYVISAPCNAPVSCRGPDVCGHVCGRKMIAW